MTIRIPRPSLDSTFRELELRRKALDSVPSDALRPTLAAIREVRGVGRTHGLRAGLFYLVLVDLVSSTKASEILGLEENVKRIERFVGLTRVALEKSKSSESGFFVKEIGDASLFLFTSFEAILDWRVRLSSLLAGFNGSPEARPNPAIRRMKAKVIVHLGEVAFGKDRNPIALAVNQIFKIEKKFSGAQFACTDIVRRTIVPRIESGQLKVRKIASAKLPGDPTSSPIWSIAPSPKQGKR